MTVCSETPTIDMTDPDRPCQTRFDWLIPAVIAASGALLLTALSLAPQDGDTELGLLFVPWTPPEVALKSALELGLPITDIRLGGRLITILVPTSGHAAITRGSMGFYMIRATQSQICGSEPPHRSDS